MNIKDIKKGMLISIKEEVIFDKNYKSRKREMYKITHPISLIGRVMGLTNKITGNWHAGQYEEPGYLSSIQTHKVVVIQLYPFTQRYYLPIYALPEDVEPEVEPYEA